MFGNLLQSLKYTPNSFEFGEVVDLEYESVGEEKPVAVAPDDPEAPTEEEKTQQDLQFTGFVKVKLFTDNTIIRATYIVPMAGRSMFLGGIPERGSVCFMVNMKGDSQTGSMGARVIIGFMPVPINMMITARHEMDSLKEGEIRIQPSSYSDATKDFYSGASIHQDIYGRMIMESGDDDFQIVIGDLLSNEYTDDVVIVKDSITGEAVCFQESYKDTKYSRRVDKAGNTMYRVLSEIWDIQGDSIRRIDGNFIVATGETLQLESNGSFLIMDADGCRLTSTQDLLLNSVGATQINSGSYVAISAFLDISMSTGSGIVAKCLKELLLSAGKKITIASSSAEILLKAFTDVEIKATANFDWVATLNAVIEAKLAATLKAGTSLTLQGGTTALLDAPIIKLGAGATEPVVKGFTVQADLLSHLHLGNLGFPTSPATATDPTIFTTILSTKSLVE